MIVVVLEYYQLSEDGRILVEAPCLLCIVVQRLLTLL